MYTSAELNTELTTDPKGLGYAANITSTNDAANAALINATTGPGAATVTLPSITRDQLAELIAPVVLAFSSASAAVQAQWQPMLTLIDGISTFNCTAANLGMLTELSAAFPNQLTAAQIAAATTRMGSRAEVLWGVGTYVSWQQIAAALGR